MDEAEQFDELSSIRRRLAREAPAMLLAVRRLPPDMHRALLLLQAFVLDVSSIPFKVDEPLLGEIRLQWWRDSLKKLRRGERLGHPVADALGPFLQTQGDELEAALLDIIDTHGAEVQKTPIVTLAAFQARLRRRFGAFFKASFLLGGVSTDERAFLFSDAGLAVGVAETFAQLPRSLAAGMKLLPLDVLESFDLDYQSLQASPPPGKTGAALLAIAEGALLTSWEVKPRLAGLCRLERKLMARWLLAPRLYSKAFEERVKGVPRVSQINPLTVFFKLLLLRG